MIKVMGLSMQQQPGIIDAFNRLLKRTRPARIIELGTGAGGLTVFLGLYSYVTNCTVYSCDVKLPKDYRLVELLNTFGVALAAGDVFSDLRREIIGGLQHSGMSLLLCDNGDKQTEFKTFAPHLKPGDIIMAHDYWHDHRVFDEEFDGTGQCEICYQDIANTCERYGLQPYMQQTFTPMLWVCRRRDFDE